MKKARFVHPVELPDGRAWKQLYEDDEESGRWSLCFSDGVLYIRDREEAPGVTVPWVMRVFSANLDFYEERHK